MKIHEYEEQFCSQNGEDGVVQKIFRDIATTNRYYVEFGYSALQGNTDHLRNQGWRGLLLDNRAERLDINLHKTFITAENIKSILHQHDVPQDFDLLSVDIDGNDAYVLDSLLQGFTPRVFIVEFNLRLGLEDKTVIYDPQFIWDGSTYFGASIGTFYKIGRKYGYSLVGSLRIGVNLFFVLDDQVSKLEEGIRAEVNQPKLVYERADRSQLPAHKKDARRREFVKFMVDEEGVDQGDGT